MAKNIEDNTVYAVIHYYDEDGGYGDAVPCEDLVAIFATEKEADQGEYRDVLYYVLSYGSHPCCYLDISRLQELKNYYGGYYMALNERECEFFDMFIDCHGGVTYVSNTLYLNDLENSGEFVGWDYAHYGDWVFGSSHPYGINNGYGDQLWCTEELIVDCLDTIDGIYADDAFAPEKAKSAYRDKLVQQIKDCGEELILRAESMVSPDLDYISNFDIHINFEQDLTVPSISFTTEIINKTAANRLRKEANND